jgi:hypothetical protein
MMGGSGLTEKIEMNKVSKEEFYAVLFANNNDIMPHLGQQKYDVEKGYTSTWKYRRTDEVFGVSDNTGYWLTKKPQ